MNEPFCLNLRLITVLRPLISQLMIDQTNNGAVLLTPILFVTRQVYIIPRKKSPLLNGYQRMEASDIERIKIPDIPVQTQ